MNTCGLARRAVWAAGLLLVIVLSLSASAQGYSPVLESPRFVLNRSLFLLWTEYTGGDFVSYDVHASTVEGFSPSSGNRVLSITQKERAYTRVAGLNPSTRYYFKVRVITTGTAYDSGQETAQTIADGVNETRVPTLMYHIVQPRSQFPSGYDAGGWMSTENFTRDMAYFKSHNVNCITHRELLERIQNGVPLPPNPLLLTFDDAYQAFLQHAVPILLAHDYVAVNAVVTRKTGGINDWAMPEWPAMRLMTWAEIKECQRKGFWMGSHTQTHVDLNLEVNKWYEIAGSRDDLQAQLKVHPAYFCYPWGMAGKRNESVLNLVSSSGFVLATRTWPAELGTISSDRFWFPRHFANANDTLRDLLNKLGMDTDKDGLLNLREMDWGLNDNAYDSDGDGLNDYQEVAYDGNAGAYNPYHPLNNPSGTDLNALAADTDDDGLTDFQELNVTFTNPLKPDHDGDGMLDGYEASHGTNPKVRDPLRPFEALPWAVPGLIEAENYDYGGAGVAYADTTAQNEGKQYRKYEGVDIAADAAASNGYVVGWTKAGEWMNYSIQAPSAAVYNIHIRVAAKGSGGSFHLRVNGVDKTGAVAIPDTGGWSTYRWITRAVSLSAGPQALRLGMNANGSSGFVGNFDVLQVEPYTPPSKDPYLGSPVNLPGVVEVENFDTGGQDVAYSDTTPANEGKQYRLDDAVDIAAQAGASNGFVVGWTKTGEWLDYAVQVASPGTYLLRVSVACNGAGGAFHVKMNGTNVTGTMTVPNTGNWAVYQWVSQLVTLSAGIQNMRLSLDAQGASGFVGNFDCIQLIPYVPPSRDPYLGVPADLPGVVEVENFDTGGQGVAYSDTTPANEGRQYRLAEAVDIAADASASNGFLVGWAKAGEWMEYTVNVVSSGTHTLLIRVASPAAGGSFRILFGGVDKTGALQVPNTGGWAAYQWMKKTVSLEAGQQILRLEILSQAANGFAGNLDQIRCLTGAGGVPYLGVPVALPGLIEVENYDAGGAGYSYHDTTPANLGGMYRLSEAVDIASSSGGGYLVGWTKAGEWMDYAVHVPLAGTYSIECRVANLGSGGRFRIEVDGQDVTGSLTVPDTGGWFSFALVTKGGIAMTSGDHLVRLVLLSETSRGVVGNFDSIRFVLSTPPPRAVHVSDDSLVVVGQGPVVADMLSSEDTQDEKPGWAVVDGDPETVWTAREAGGWLTMAYDRDREVRRVNILWGEDSPTNLTLLGSVDAVEWSEVLLEQGPVTASYLWFIFKPDEGLAPPVVSEIQVE